MHKKKALKLLKQEDAVKVFLNEFESLEKKENITVSAMCLLLLGCMIGILAYSLSFNSIIWSCLVAGMLGAALWSSIVIGLDKLTSHLRQAFAQKNLTKELQHQLFLVWQAKRHSLSTQCNQEIHKIMTRWEKNELPSPHDVAKLIVEINKVAHGDIEAVQTPCSKSHQAANSRYAKWL